MGTLLTSFDPTSAASGSFTAAFSIAKCGTLHVKNASSVDVLFSINNSPSMQTLVQAGEPRNILVPMPRATVYWSQKTVLNNNGNQQQSVVYVESYESGEVIPSSQSTSPNVNTGNFVGNQQSYSIFVKDTHANQGFFTIATAPTGQSIYIGAIDFTLDTSAAGVHQIFLELLGIDQAFSNNGTMIWRKTCSQGTPYDLYRLFPGPLKCDTAGTLQALSADTISDSSCDLIIYYFIK